MALFLSGFALGMLVLYILQSLDILLQLFSSWASVIVTKNNATMIELQPIDDNAPRVGFQYVEEPEYYYDEEFEEE